MWGSKKKEEYSKRHIRASLYFLRIETLLKASKRSDDLKVLNVMMSCFKKDTNARTELIAPVFKQNASEL